MNTLVTLIFFVYLSCGLRITSSKRSRLIERLGKFNREMQPGLSYLLPGVERVVSHESLKELDQATDPWGVKVKRVEMRDIIPSKGVKEAMEAQMTAEREKRAEILRSEGNKEAVLNNARAEAESLVLDAKAKQEAVLLAADADAKKQQMLANANAEAALSIAKAIGESQHTEEALRLLLAKDWMKMGEEMAHAKAGSVLMVDPQSPASLVAALKQFQQADKSETDCS